MCHDNSFHEIIIEMIIMEMKLNLFLSVKYNVRNVRYIFNIKNFTILNY